MGKLSPFNKGDVVVLQQRFDGDPKQKQLQLAKHQRIEVVKTYDSGWTLGRDNGGNVGFFPTTFGRVQEREKETREPPKDGLVEAMYNYTSQSKSHMSIKTGDRITIVTTNEKGWSLGVNHTTEERGYFPSNYVTPVHSKTKCKYKHCNRTFETVDKQQQYCDQCAIYKRYKQMWKIDRDNANRPYIIKHDKSRAVCEKNRIMYLMLARMANLAKCSQEDCRTVTSGHSEIQFCPSHLPEYYFLNEYTNKPNTAHLRNNHRSNNTTN